MASIEIPSGIKVLSATTVDDLGKFDAVDEATAVALALSTITAPLRYVGRKVLCNGVEYVFSSLADSGLLPSASYVIQDTEGSSFAIGKERYNMEIDTFSVTSNILTINFKVENRGFSNIIIKSQLLGITEATAFNVIVPTFPNYRDFSVYQVDLESPLVGTSYAQADIPTTASDIEIVNFGLYINDSIVSIQRISGVVTVTLNRTGAFPTISCNIDSSVLGITSVNNTFYTLTKDPVSNLIYTFPNAGTDTALIPYDGSNFVIYTQSNIERGIHGIFDSMETVKRARFSSSVGRAFTLIGDIDWRTGTTAANMIYTQLGWVGDSTGEFLPTYSTIWNNNEAQPRLFAHRPRVNPATTYNQYYGQGVTGGVTQFDTAFNSNQYYIPVTPSVSTHTNIVGNGTIATITCTSPHALTTGDTVIINSTPLGLVNASVVVTVTTTSAFTFPYTTVVTSQADATGYNYLTHAQRTTTTVVNTTGTSATITTSIAHGYAVGQTVFVHSSLLSLVGVPVNITAVPTTTSFSFADATTIATATADTGYSNKSIYPFLKTVERDASNIVSLKFTSAPNQFDGTLTSVVAVGFQVGSYLRIVNTSLIGSATATPFNIQNILNEYGAVTATGAVAFPNVIQFKNTGSVLAPTLNGASTTLVNFSQKYHSRALGKAKDHRTHGWFIAGTEPANNAGDKFMYDRLRVGYYANMGSLGWNYYTLPNVPSRAYFGRHSYFGNTITEVTATDINVVSDGAFIVGNTTAVATTRKGIVKFDSTTNQLSFSDGAKYFKVNEERIKFLFEGNIGNIALTKLNSVGEVNTLMSSAVYINKATEISEIYFIIGSVAAGQTSGQITVTLQHVALGQTLEIDAATVGTTVATATYNFVNGVTISRYVKNTLSSITGSIPADRMLFAKIQTTSPFNGGANAVQDIVVTVKLR